MWDRKRALDNDRRRRRLMPISRPLSRDQSRVRKPEVIVGAAIAGSFGGKLYGRHGMRKCDAETRLRGLADVGNIYNWRQ